MVLTATEGRRRLPQLVKALYANDLETALVLKNGVLAAALLPMVGASEQDLVALAFRHGRLGRDGIRRYGLTEARQGFLDILRRVEAGGEVAIFGDHRAYFEPRAGLVPPRRVREELLRTRPKPLLEALLPLGVSGSVARGRRRR